MGTDFIRIGLPLYINLEKDLCTLGKMIGLISVLDEAEKNPSTEKR